jgi:hypothetical protein
VWKVRRTGKADVGTVAGGQTDGRYWKVGIKNRKYLAHRIIFKMLRGVEPTIVDHRDGNGLNNRIRNLRAADKRINTLNRGVYTSNKTGVRNVRFDKRLGKYIARFARKHLGCFDKIEDAALAVSRYEKKTGIAKYRPNKGK